MTAPSVRFSLGFLFAVSTVAAACSNGDAEADRPAANVGAQAATQLTFAQASPLSLSLGQSVELRVVVSPPGPADVRFALLDDHRDASLDQIIVTADADGVARNTLHAAKDPTAFRVRATLSSGEAAELAVSVSGEGFGEVVVQPRYKGSRKLPAFTASVVVGPSCGEITAPQGDGPLVGEPSDGGAIKVKGVPSRSRAAVLVRAAGLAFGCTTIDSLSPAESRTVTVDVKNVPVDVTASSFLLGLGLPADAGQRAPLVTRWTKRFAVAFKGGADDGATALLDTMLVLAPAASRGDFLSMRAERQWDTALREAFAMTEVGGPDVVTGPWMTVATDQLENAPWKVIGTLSAETTPKGKAVLSLVRFLNLFSDEGASLPSKTVALAVGADDVAQASGEIAFWPAQVVAREVERRAKAETGAATMLEALELQVGCDQVAKAMRGGAKKAFSGCDQACAQQLCEQALSVMWQRAASSDELSGTSAAFSFSVSGVARTDEQARLTGFEGAWVGAIVDDPADTGSLEMQLSGSGGGGVLPKHGNGSPAPAPIDDQLRLARCDEQRRARAWALP